MSWYTNEAGGFLDILKKKFEADNPEYALEYITVPAGQINDRLQTMIAAGEAPDVSLLAFDWLAAMAESKMIVSIDKLAKQSYPLQELFPPIQKAMQWKGEYFALPQRITAKVFYYNRTHIREAGANYPADNWNWKDFLTLAKKVQRTNGSEVTRWGFMTDFVLDGHYHWYASNSADWFNADRTKLTMSDSKTVEVMQFLQDLIYGYGITPPPAVASALKGTSGAFFADKTTMQVGGSGTPDPKTYPTLDWGAANIPMNTQPGGRVWANLWVIPTGVRDLNLSWKALSYFAGPVGQQIAFDTRVGLPALRKMALTEKYDHNYRDYLLGAFSFGNPYPVIANRQVWDVFNAQFSKLWANQASARQVADAIQQQAESLMPK
jgi:multiple sugar transport system substrate-binding protein